jgi:hypothetical protein
MLLWGLPGTRNHPYEGEAVTGVSYNTSMRLPIKPLRCLLVLQQAVQAPDAVTQQRVKWHVRGWITGTNT